MSKLIFLASIMAYMQRQLRELTDAATQTTEWMRKHDACANDIDKSLDSLRNCLDALQSASVSSVETKSVALPKVAGLVGSGSNRRPSQSHTPGESAGSAQPPGKRQKPSFSPSQKGPEEWYQQDDEFQRSAVLVKFSCSRSKESARKFCIGAFPDTDPESYDVKCKKGSDPSPVSLQGSVSTVCCGQLERRVPVHCQKPFGCAQVRWSFCQPNVCTLEEQVSKRAPVVERKKARVCITD